MKSSKLNFLPANFQNLLEEKKVLRRKNSSAGLNASASSDNLHGMPSVGNMTTEQVRTRGKKRYCSVVV